MDVKVPGIRRFQGPPEENQSRDPGSKKDVRATDVETYHGLTRNLASVVY
jgi:hypothetical protein